MRKPLMIAALGLIIANTGHATTLSLGDRVYSPDSTYVFSSPNLFNSAAWGTGTLTIGVAKITDIRSDGSVVIEAEERRAIINGKTKTVFPLVTITLTKEQAARLKPKVSCPDLEGRPLYSNTRYQQFVTNGYVPKQVGIFQGKEVFGSCKDGLITVNNPSSDLLDNVGQTTPAATVPVTSVLKSVTCDYSNKSVYSNEILDVPFNHTWVKMPAGAGVAKQVFGDCAKGIVDFHANRESIGDVTLSAAGIATHVNSIEVGQSAQIAQGPRKTQQ